MFFSPWFAELVQAEGQGWPSPAAQISTVNASFSREIRKKTARYATKFKTIHANRAQHGKGFINRLYKPSGFTPFPGELARQQRYRAFSFLKNIGWGRGLGLSFHFSF